MKEKILVIVGPTTSGKSDLAVTVALKYNGEIVSADSRQVFRGLDATTGKVSEEEMKGVPHHLLSVVDPGKEFTAYNFCELAIQKIQDIHNRGKLPILVGGSGFYIDVVLFKNSITNVPIDKVYRKELEDRELEELQREFLEKDEEAYERIDTKNPVRLIRALEIVRSLGFLPKRKREERYEYIMIGVKRSRPNLKERIVARLEKRFSLIVSEIQDCLDNGVPEHWFERIGLECRHVMRMLCKGVSEEETKQNLVKAIFAYAKRQDTWWRRYKQIKWFEEHELKQVYTYVRDELGLK